MANRIIRDWTNSENIEKLSFGAEVFFTRLIMKADDFGCYHGNPKLLLAHLFPLKEISAKEIESFIKECSKVKLINIYFSEEKAYLEIINFGQRLRQMNRKFPVPTKENTQSAVIPPSTVSSPRLEVEDEVETEDEVEVEIAETSSADLNHVNDESTEKEKTAFTDVDAKPVKPKKEKKLPAVKEPSVYTECFSHYDKFIRYMGGIPLFDEVTGAIMKKIIAKLRTISIDKGEGQDKEVSETFYGILKGYNRWQAFHQSQTDLKQINHNLQSLIIAVKNPNSTQNGKQQPTSLWAKSQINPFGQPGAV